MNKLLTRFVIFFVACLMLGPVYAEDPDVKTFDQFDEVSFAWDANQEPDLVGYRLYKSSTSGQYTFGAENAVDEIPAGVEEAGPYTFEVGTWYFVLTAFDTEGFESNPSNEVSATIINTPPSAPTGCSVLRF